MGGYFVSSKCSQPKVSYETIFANFQSHFVEAARADFKAGITNSDNTLSTTVDAANGWKSAHTLNPNGSSTFQLEKDFSYLGDPAKQYIVAVEQRVYTSGTSYTIKLFDNQKKLLHSFGGRYECDTGNLDGGKEGVLASLQIIKAGLKVVGIDADISYFKKTGTFLGVDYGKFAFVNTP